MTENIRLSRIAITDRDATFDLLQHVEVMKYLGPRRPLSDAEAQAWFEHEFTQQKRFAFRLPVSGELVGFCGVTEIDGVDDFGYFLRRKFWGKGFAKKMCQLAVSELAASTDFDQVKVFIADSNVSSQKIAQYLGWKKYKAASNDYEHGALYQIKRP
ncbi:GNAT family N-acetyltransferase [Veronia pacifica]|uniref:GNAT family acetyltransferase n=1 Tax=Veronia pacifica TaxID=1080227 RepID=A0A1C3EBH1_9GAMM|nr:GNAT family N-acetyltransferase [Veronia pacifica]ODA30607.1 GNAT family acetyltransferase [Veronia pacifica]